MSNFLSPPKPVKRDDTYFKDQFYKSKRLQVFLGIYIGYAAYYLVRKNLTLAMPFLKQEYGYTIDYLGTALACNGLGYGISKFVMGGISDRSDARKFFPLGLILTSLVIIAAGSDIGVSNLIVIGALQFLIGWFGGMGWPPCGRVMTHWFSISERGSKMSIWNTAHNIGGMLIGPITAFATSYLTILGIQQSWKLGIFVVPACIAIIIAAVAYLLIRDNPQSCGLPSIEQYKNDYPPDYSDKAEEVMTPKEIFFKYVLKNRILWIVASANAFVYFVRYGVLDWAPTYLNEVKGYDIKQVGWAYFAYEFAAIPGTIVCGFVSDYIFKGRRAVTTIIFMLLIMIAIYVYWKNENNIMIDISALISIGFLIYGPVMLIGVQALDLAPKNAAGASAGLTGFFGYLIGTAILSNILMGYVAQHFGWGAGFKLLIASTIVASILMAFTIPDENRKYKLKMNKKSKL
ncbi:phosphoglycerate transporter protein PgtP [Apibacter sp. HY039]|uniref:phosphoglycerate transporter protein PgtP n=1 Tax=Apibacter sp. HY039 TaxID=2501476 RepID=UPI000FEC0048|nr:phosphoglycerate transporter protein PgtP [Apibacter sp. HY039]